MNTLNPAGLAAVGTKLQKSKNPTQLLEIGCPGLGPPGRRLPGDRRAPGTPGLLQRAEHPGRTGCLLPPVNFPEPPHRVGEAGHADTGLLSSAAKHIYFQGSRKKFRVHYGHTVSFDSYEDGFGIMRDAQTGKSLSTMTC